MESSTDKEESKVKGVAYRRGDMADDANTPHESLGRQTTRSL